MMKTIEAILEPITGYLFSITRNTLKGWYEMEIGIPKGWVFTDNDEIKCHVVEENANGKLILIAPLPLNRVLKAVRFLGHEQNLPLPS